MEAIQVEEIELIGLSLGHKTTNADGQSMKDCGLLWQQFERGKYPEKIPQKKDNSILAVYHDYDGDHTLPYSYFIGCRVEAGAPVPAGMVKLNLPQGKFLKIVSKGEMPGCVGKTWMDIWASDIKRAYKADFEVYDERSSDWKNAEVDVFISVF